MQRLHIAPLSHGHHHRLRATPRLAVAAFCTPRDTTTLACLRTRPPLAAAKTLLAPSRPALPLPLPLLHARRLHTSPSTMAQNDTTPEWAAARVRSTFLDYFKERGHTFGESRLHCRHVFLQATD